MTAYDEKFNDKASGLDPETGPGLRDSGYGGIDSKEVDHDKSTSSTPDQRPGSHEGPVVTDIETPQPSGPPLQDGDEDKYQPKTLKFWLVIASVIVSTFIVALDRTIIATAIPEITNDFKSLGDIGWYGSSYMLTTAAFQLLFGRVYRFYDLKWTFLLSIVVFEVGSVLCASAPSSPVFILGRSIAGLGSAGIMTGSMMIIIPMVPLHKRPMFQSMFGMVFAISSITGPLIGGAFTERATWRWCFWMNLPIGAIAFACIFFLLNLPKKEVKPATLKQHVMRLDPLGTLFFIPCMVCLVLALQWGGSQYAWSSWRIIVLFVFFALTAIAFGTVQVMMPDSATLPVRVIKQRTMIVATSYMLFIAGSMFLIIYYLPLWFQTTHGVDPVKSGIYILPLVISMGVAAPLSGAFTQKIGYYVPSMLLCPSLMAIGAGLLSTLKPSSGSPSWIGFQVLIGFGLGCGVQTAGLAVQATLPMQDIPTGIAITFWAQQLGGAIFVSVGQTILSGLLVERLDQVSGLDPKIIVNTGATDLHEFVSDKEFGTVINAYNYACTRIFLAALALSVAQLLSACFVPWKSIKKNKKGPPGQAGAAQQPEK